MGLNNHGSVWKMLGHAQNCINYVSVYVNCCCVMKPYIRGGLHVLSSPTHTWLCVILLRVPCRHNKFNITDNNVGLTNHFPVVYKQFVYFEFLCQIPLLYLLSHELQVEVLTSPCHEESVGTLHAWVHDPAEQHWYDYIGIGMHFSFTLGLCKAAQIIHSSIVCWDGPALHSLSGKLKPSFRLQHCS